MEYHRTGWFALPGGFVRTDEALDDAVLRGLRERTGLDNLYLRQFHAFGGLERHDPNTMRTILELSGYTPDAMPWLLERFVSVAYYALIDYRSVQLRPDALSDSIEWYDVDALPPLLFDHAEIVERALQTLRNNLDADIVGKNLLPPRFTMKELQYVYEAILGQELRRSSFQRKMLSSCLLRRHNKLQQGKAHKAPYLYSFAGESPE